MEELILKLKRLFPERLHASIFLVGGMVRDILLELRCQDVDLAAAVPCSELTALGFRLVESQSTPDIYFLFHKELGKIEVTWLPSLDALADDLSRRDFTINAMAMPLSFDGTLHDPLNGRRDLANRLLSTCTPKSLSDDPLRVFRAFRFECEGWRLDSRAEETLAGGDWSGRFAQVPVERFSQEMLKGLAKDDPCRFFRRMLQFHVGENFLPEIFAMAKVPAGPPQHHPEGDLFTHSMQVLERMARLTPEIPPRFCALFHDLGKLYTPAQQHPKHHGHDALGADAVPAFCKRLRLPAALQRALQATNRLHTTANRWDELRDATKIKLALNAIKGGIGAFLALQVAADCGGTMPGWDEALRVASMSAVQLGIDRAFLDSKEFPPEKLQQVIMQHRVEVFRGAKGLS